MSQREIVSRYNLIINKVRRCPCTFKEMVKHLEIESEIQSYDFNKSKRTFKRDLDDIRSLYNIDIQFDFSRKVYFINLYDMPEVNDRILEAFDTFNALNISHRLSDHIHFEKRRPAGTENLYGILHAIKNRLSIKFSYQKFWENEVTLRSAEPYALKEFKSRWYVMSKDQKDNKIKSFALDRLTNLEISNRSFIYPEDYDIEENYRYCFGIISPNDQPPQEIILSFDPIQGKYIKSLPLHHSQQILIDSEHELRIKLKICITYDLVMELLSFGEFLKVIEPASLIKEITNKYNKALAQYVNVG